MGVHVSSQKAPPQRADPRRSASHHGPCSGYAATAPIERLQRAVGNRALSSLLRSPVVQPKLTVSHPDDPYEREADRVADQVMRMLDPRSRLNRDPVRTQSRSVNYERELQRKPIVTMRRWPAQIHRKCTGCADKAKPETNEPEEEKPLVQAKHESDNPPAASSEFESYLSSSRGGGQRLSASTRDYFESRFGHDFGNVRVHTNSRAHQASADIGARAFTSGFDIYFRHGEYQPGTPTGDRLLGHELTHVVQQNAVATPVAARSLQRLGPSLSTPGAGFIQRVADKSNVPTMVCPPDPAPGQPVGRDIQFGKNDSSLDFVDRLKIFFEHFLWFNRGGIDTIVIEGFASTDGPPGDNWRLSCRRAEAVKAEFVRLGVDPAMITTIAHGETEEFSATALEPNRVAVIRMVAGVAPTAFIFPVIFRGSFNRVAPGRTTPVIVALFGLPAGRTVDLDIEGSGGANGTATVAPASITGFAIVGVTGGTQTTPGNARNLRVRARLAGLTLDRSPGFTVAAHPADFSVTLNSDLNTPTEVGLLANNAWDSDGTGGVAELDQVMRGEATEQGHQDRPPFFSGLGAASGKSAGNISPRTDRHSEPRSAIRPDASNRGRVSTDVVKQLFIFDDARTGLTDQTAVNSGFTITSTVTFNAATSGFEEQTVKTGAATTVGTRSSDAGSGTATSLVHPL